MSIAWVFPGQGSQKLGMADPIISLPDAEERFALASRLMGRDLLAICRGSDQTNHDPADLNDTRNTQPALFVVESLLVDNALLLVGAFLVVLMPVELLRHGPPEAPARLSLARSSSPHADVKVRHASCVVASLSGVYHSLPQPS